MSRLITIAGPQSSGKSTAIDYLSAKYSGKGIEFIREISPYAVMDSDHPKYLQPFKIQEGLTKRAIKLLRTIKSDKNTIIETGPMQIIYVEKYTGVKKADYYFKEYLKIVKPLNPIFIFIETKPEVSFKRRKNKYTDRIKRHGLLPRKDKILKQYEEKIYDLYPRWHKWLDKFPYEKIVIKNNYKTKKKFLGEVEDVVNSLIQSDSVKPPFPGHRRRS